MMRPTVQLTPMLLRPASGFLLFADETCKHPGEKMQHATGLSKPTTLAPSISSF